MAMNYVRHKNAPRDFAYLLIAPLPPWVGRVGSHDRSMWLGSLGLN